MPLRPKPILVFASVHRTLGRAAIARARPFGRKKTNVGEALSKQLKYERYYNKERYLGQIRHTVIIYSQDSTSFIWAAGTTAYRAGLSKNNRGNLLNWRKRTTVFVPINFAKAEKIRLRAGASRFWPNHSILGKNSEGAKARR